MNCPPRKILCQATPLLRHLIPMAIAELKQFAELEAEDSNRIPYGSVCHTAGSDKMPGYRDFFCSFCATRARTNFFTKAAGIGLSKGKRIVPLEVG